ncbi:MAG: hypothetical protein EPN25_15335 [Nitrospirae bacterium]|nr:MAG: hypothetical protein EPN25_15335 [Nitrospirota bacterium]
MSATVFIELKFWLLLVLSVIAPVTIYGVLLAKRAVSWRTVLVLGLTLVVIAGVDLYLLQALAEAAKTTPSLADDAVFLSEMTVALYLFPALFAGVGINVISHVLVRRLNDAERKFERDHPDA